MAFTDSIHVTLRPSPTLRLINALIHVGALAVILVLAWYRPLFWPFTAALAVSVWRSDRQLRLQGSNTPIHFRWAFDHRLQWRTRSGAEFRGECVAARSWGCLWVRLRVRHKGRRRMQTLFIPADAVTPDVHRRLRARCLIVAPDRSP